MDEDQYDEFGNYIGGNLESSSDDSEKESEEEEEENNGNEMEEEDEQEVVSNQQTAIVLHEDKQYYPDAEDIYPGVEIEVNPEDEQDITVPIINPIKAKVFSVLEKEIPTTVYTNEFLTSLMDKPDLMRNVVVLGSIHHGKTTFLDMLIESTHVVQWSDDVDTRYTDTRKDEQERGISIGSTPVSIILQSSRGKSYLLNIIDTPGHVDFSGEITAAIRLADCAFIVVDAVEGVNMTTNRYINEALREGLSLILVINKMDRLILELKLPPADVYHKLHQIIEEVNITVTQFPTGDNSKRHVKLNPILGNVLFASSQHRWCFSLLSYAQQYSEIYHNNQLNVDSFVKYLWGNYYYDNTTRKFTAKEIKDKGYRSFVQFCLEPIYKIYTQAVGEDSKSLGSTLKTLGIKFKKSELHKNVKPLLRFIMRKYFVNGLTCIVDSLLQHTKSPVQAAEDKILRIYKGNQSTEIAESMRKCDANGPLMIHITKLYPTPDSKDFLAFGRIMSGTIHQAEKVNILGEDYSLDDPEDMTTKEITSIAIAEGRYKIDVDHLSAGNWILIEGVSDTIFSTATICDIKTKDVEIFNTLSFTTLSSIKVSVEALKPSEVPKMENGLRCVCKCYPLIKQKVEESGEHVIFGTGELQLDCVLHDLRVLFGDLEVKVADPVVSFCETVIDISTLKCFATTPNKANKLTMIAEPIDEKLDLDIENKIISLNMPKKQLSDYMKDKYNWDLLASRSIWAFGPTDNSPNILLDDTLSDEVNKNILYTVKDHIIQGFRWACKEGPLCDEPIRGVKFKLTDAIISTDNIQRGAGQIIPTARRVVYSSVLLASPRLMEPVNYIEIICPADLVKPVQEVLALRRGLVSSERPKPGTPFFVLYAYIPVIESFGFEVDLRVHTQGLAFCQHTFDHWQLVEGDPLDTSIILHQMEPAPVQHLCREFMIKTRRRKGLAEDVSAVKFFDPEMLIELKQQEENMSEL